MNIDDEDLIDEREDILLQQFLSEVVSSASGG